MTYYKRYARPKIPFYRRNNYIQISPIQLIDENGKNIGITETRKALEMAQNRGLDLIEIVPNIRPPVCKIMSWSKFKYRLSKKKKSSSKGKSKEMRFSPYISTGDIEHKLKRVNEFLDKKYPVKLTVFVRKRVQDEALFSLLEKILKMLEGKYETEEKPRKEGKNLVVNIFPKKASSKIKKNITKVENSSK